MTKLTNTPECVELPGFIPLTQEQLDAGLDDDMIELLRSVLNVEGFERELGRIIMETTEPETPNKAA